MAEHLASIFGTEKDRVNCPFYFKIGACRHGDRCSRLHSKPSISPTLLLSNMYQRPDMITPGVDSQGNPIDPREMQKHFEVLCSTSPFQVLTCLIGLLFVGITMFLFGFLVIWYLFDFAPRGRIIVVHCDIIVVRVYVYLLRYSVSVFHFCDPLLFQFVGDCHKTP